MGKLNKSNAYQIDKSGEFYAEQDAEYGWGVFGSETGFCYFLGCEEECKEHAVGMNQRKAS